MEPWQYNPAEDLDRSLRERLQHFPREPSLYMHSLRMMGGAMIRTWLYLYHRIAIHGKANLPRERAFVMVANHCSHLDALCLQAAIGFDKIHRVFPAAAKDYFFSSLTRSAFSATFVNALPFDRKVNSAQSLALCKALLEKPGNILILFPEGTRSKTGEVQSFKTGIARLIVGTAIPVVPCYLAGCHEAFGKGKAWPRPRPISLWIGKPMSFEGMGNSETAIKDICHEIFVQVKALRPERYPKN